MIACLANIIAKDVLDSFGKTLLVNKTTSKSLSLSAQTKVPVKPVCPKEFLEKYNPQGLGS